MTAPSSLIDTVAALADGTVTATALAQRALGAIADTQATINAFRWIRDEQARADAAEADRRLAAGERAPLLGVPVAIKDDMDLEGFPTAFGCAGPFPPSAVNSEVVRRLRAAGAIIVGKTNAPEVGMYPVTEGPAFGATRNPWDMDHTPGGSSGGSAASVAAGIVPCAVGSDGAGSIRIPAAWTGLVGVKPQRGRVSSWPAVNAFYGIATHGPLTRTVADAALLLDVLTGSHDGDIYRAPAPQEPFAEAVGREGRPLRIALSLRAPYVGIATPLHPQLQAATLRIADVLREQGHAIVEMNPPYGLMGPPFLSRSLGGVADWVDRVPDRSLLDERTCAAARTGRLARRFTPLAAALDARFARRVGHVFERADVVLTPATAQPPPRVGCLDGRSGFATDRFIAAACPYSWTWNMLGWPAMSVPAGLTSAGLPIGVQLLGRPNDEATLLTLAAGLERIEGWPARVPPLTV